MPESLSSLGIETAPPAAAPSTPAKQPKKAVESSEPPQCKLASFKFRELISNRYFVVLPKAVTLEQAKNETFMERCLALKARDFKSFDEVLCVHHLCDWGVEYMVVDSQLGRVSLEYIRQHSFTKRISTNFDRIPPGYSIAKDRVSNLWYAQRDSDDLKFIEGCPRYEDALRELIDHAIFRQG